MKKYLLSALLLIMVLFLSACGCEVNSVVTVNPDESGTRVMELTIPKTEIKTYGKLSLSEIDSIIADGCPDCMTYAYEEDKKNVKATFTLPFSSYEDYENKLKSFCKGDVEITGYSTKSPFAQEIEYSESISTREMLKWLPDVLIEKKVLNERYRASVFGGFSTKLILNGKEYDGGSGRLSVKEDVYCQIDSIDLYTAPAGGNKFSRVIKLNIKRDELEKNEDAIREFLSGVAPEGCFADWETTGYDEVQIYTVTITSFTPEEMQDAMEHFTGGGYAHFEGEEETSLNGLFGKKCGFTENIDWSNYICSPSRTVNIRYVLDQNNTLGEIIDMEGGAYRKVNSSPMDASSSYMVYSLGEQYETTVKAQLEQYYHFSSIDYSIDAKGINELRKEISLHFDNAKTEDIGVICDSIREMGKTDEVVAKIKTQLSETTLTLIFEGKADEINHMMNAVCGREEGDGLSYACENKWLVPLEKCIVEDVVDLEGIVYQGNSTEYWQIPVHYSAKIYGVDKELINDQPLVSEKMSGFEGDFTSDRRMKAVYQTKRINGLAFVWYLLLLLAAAAFLGGVYFLIRSLFEKKKENKEEQLAREIGVGEAVEIEEKAPEAIEDKGEIEASGTTEAEIIEVTGETETAGETEAAGTTEAKEEVEASENAESVENAVDAEPVAEETAVVDEETVVVEGKNAENPRVSE